MCVCKQTTNPSSNNVFTLAEVDIGDGDGRDVAEEEEAALEYSDDEGHGMGRMRWFLLMEGAGMRGWVRIEEEEAALCRR